MHKRPLVTPDRPSRGYIGQHYGEAGSQEPAFSIQGQIVFGDCRVVAEGVLEIVGISAAISGAGVWRPKGSRSRARDGAASLTAAPKVF